jgi:hypothetical protein
MSVLAGLKLVAAKPQLVMDPVQLRRNKLVSKLDEQIALAKAVQEGGNYTPMRAKRVKDAAGNVSVVQVPKRVKAWYWAVEGGKVCVAVRYGGKQLELSKGKTAVETTAAELTATLAVLRKAVESGEIDAQIEAVSAGVRRGFKK